MPLEVILFYGIARCDAPQATALLTERTATPSRRALLVLVLPVSVAVDPLVTRNPVPALPVLVLPVSSAVDPRMMRIPS